MSLSNKPASPLDIQSRRSCIQLWRRIFNSEPPLRIGIALLTAMLAQAQQESTLASTFRMLEKQLSSTNLPDSSTTQSKAKLRIGDRIVRRWGGTNHEVIMLQKGFSYRGEVFRSLSEIARLITGVRWSGPRFFGTNEKRV